MGFTTTKQLVLVSCSIALALCISVDASCCWAGEEEFDFDKYVVDLLYSKFKGTSGFTVACSLEGSAESIGITQQRTMDRVKLRLANTVSNVPILRSTDNVESSPALYTKLGLVHVTVWTVGDEYPVAYHIEIMAGVIGGDIDIFTNAVLGYGNSQNVRSAVDDAIDDLVDSFAVAFHKGVGDF